MKIKLLPTLDRLNLCFDYNPETGIFIHKDRKEIRQNINVKFRGQIAGSINKNGHRLLSVGGKHYLAHRVAFFLTYNEQPHMIDHLNGDPDDNRITNLRSVTAAQNQSNQKLTKRPISGITGVYFDKRRNKYTARIKHQRVTISLGSFINLSEAIVARNQAKKYYGFTDRHGYID